MPKKVNHTYFSDNGRRLICERCGGSDAAPDVPVAWDYFVARIKLFNKFHRNCPEVNKVNNVNNEPPNEPE